MPISLPSGKMLKAFQLPARKTISFPDIGGNLGLGSANFGVNFKKLTGRNPSVFENGVSEGFLRVGQRIKDLEQGMSDIISYTKSFGQQNLSITADALSFVTYKLRPHIRTLKNDLSQTVPNPITCLNDVKVVLEDADTVFSYITQYGDNTLNYLTQMANVIDNITNNW